LDEEDHLFFVSVLSASISGSRTVRDEFNR
jgi:hypothetical protein